MNIQIKFEYKQGNNSVEIKTIEGNNFDIEIPSWDLDIETIKLLTGNEPIYARTLYKTPRYTRPHYKIPGYIDSPIKTKKVIEESCGICYNSPIKTKKVIEESCGICYNSMNSPIILSCSHKFCFNCVNNFDKYNITKCPMCRADIDIFNEDSIRSVMIQCKCARKTAITELIKNNGNIVDAILSIL